MSLDKQAVAKIARLARIKVDEADQTAIAQDLSGIIDWVEQLAEVDTDDVPQMTSVAAMRLPIRKDEVTDGGQQKAVLANAPEQDYGCFAVPKVIE